MPDLLFAHDFPPMGGGIARWMEALARGYPPAELVVSTGQMPDSTAIDAALPQRIDRIGTSSHRLKLVPGATRWSLRAIRLAQTTNARFAWCDSVRPAGHPARWARRVTGLPYGIIVHGGDLLTLHARMQRGAVRRRRIRSILQGASVFVANSHWTADRCGQLLTDAGLLPVPSRIRVVPLGADAVAPRPDAAAVAGFRAVHGLPDARWMLTVARLVPHKGIDTVVRVLAQLCQPHPDLHYLVVGRGSYESLLRALAAELGVADRVHILTDVANADLRAAYASADIYVGLSRETATDVEGFGIAFVEAAAQGLPVVATRSGGIPDAVADGLNGTLVPADDVPAAAIAVDHLLRDPTRARALGAAGRARVEQYLNWNRVVDEMRGIAEEFGRDGRVAGRGSGVARKTRSA